MIKKFRGRFLDRCKPQKNARTFDCIGWQIERCMCILPYSELWGLPGGGPQRGPWTLRRIPGFIPQFILRFIPVFQDLVVLVVLVVLIVLVVLKSEEGKAELQGGA